MGQKRERGALAIPNDDMPHTWMEGCLGHKQGGQWNGEASIPSVMPPDTHPHTSSVLLSLVQLSLTSHPLSALVFFSPTCSNSSPDKNCSLNHQSDATLTQLEWQFADAITSSLPRLSSPEAHPPKCLDFTCSPRR